VMEVAGPSCVALAVLKEAKWKSNKKAVAEGKPIWLAGQRPGQGRVVIFGNHPEFGTKKYPDGHRGVYDAIFWCTAGDERAVELGGDKSDRPAGWFDLAAGQPQDAAKQIAAAQEQVSLAIKANEAAPKPKSDWRGTYKKLAHAELSSLLASLEKMKMTGGGDKAGWFAGRREQLIAELLSSLKQWPSPLTWEPGDVMRNMPTESAAKFEEWARDYGYFLTANGRPAK